MRLVKNNSPSKHIRVNEAEYTALFDTILFLREKGKVSEAQALDGLAKKIHIAIFKSAANSKEGADSVSAIERFGIESVPQSPLEFIESVISVKALLSEFDAGDRSTSGQVQGQSGQVDLTFLEY